MIDFSRTMNLFFWFSWSLSIVMTLSSAISAKKTNDFLSLSISEKRANILFSLINFFIVNNRFFNIFIAFFKSSKTIESWVTFVAILIIFFAKAETFEYIFFKLRKLSVDTNQFEKQKRDQNRRIVSMKKERKKNDESRKNLSFVKINERRVETLQSIKHDRIWKFNHSDRTFENERKNFENQNDFDYFFHRNSNLFF